MHIYAPYSTAKLKWPQKKWKNSFTKFTVIPNNFTDRLPAASLLPASRATCSPLPCPYTPIIAFAFPLFPDSRLLAQKS